MIVRMCVCVYQIVYNRAIRPFYPINSNSMLLPLVLFIPVRCYLSLYRGQDLLSPTGCFYMVAVEDNDPAQIASVVEGYGVKAEVTAQPTIPTGAGEKRTA